MTESKDTLSTITFRYSFDHATAVGAGRIMVPIEKGRGIEGLWTVDSCSPGTNGTGSKCSVNVLKVTSTATVGSCWTHIIQYELIPGNKVY